MQSDKSILELTTEVEMATLSIPENQPERKCNLISAHMYVLLTSNLLQEKLLCIKLTPELLSLLLSFSTSALAASEAPIPS